MLTWQKNSPRFVVEGHVGDTLTLYFDTTNIDDIELPEFYFIVELVKRDEGWSLDARLRSIETNLVAQKPQVSKLMSKLQQAIETGVEFDFRRYFNRWSKQFKDFAIVLTDTHLPYAVPVRVSPRQPNPDGGNKGVKKMEVEVVRRNGL